MNLQNFEAYIDNKILLRGRDYFECGHIISLEYGDNEWIAEVDGSDEYSVHVTLSDGGEILDTYCDCPYDWGNYCKHQVAVFFALKEKGTAFLAEATTQKANKKESIESILSKLDNQTLISLIIEYAKVYKPMKSEILFRYAEKEDITKSARQVIRSAINAVKHRGYVEYKDVGVATDGADIVIQMIEDKIDAGELLTAVSLGIIVAEEMMDLLSYCDDSNGYVGDAISMAIEKMQDAVISMPENYIDSKKIFEAIFTHALSDMYNGWTDWRTELLFSLVPLCYDSQNKAQLENYLSAPISNDKDASEWSRDYELREKQGLQLELIRQFGDKIAVKQYIEQNLDNISFRYMTINSAMENGDYDEAICLCIEGEKDNSRYAGIVKNLRKLRFTAYEAAENKAEQKSLALELLLDDDFDYFIKYKGLHSKSEWTTLLYEILEKTEKSSLHGIYVKILIHEKHKPRLLAYCEKMPRAIVNYHTHLLPEYKHEVGQLFSDYIRQCAEMASSRNSYQEICQLIKTCDTICPEATDAVCAEILEKYANALRLWMKCGRLTNFKINKNAINIASDSVFICYIYIKEGIGILLNYLLLPIRPNSPNTPISIIRQLAKLNTAFMIHPTGKRRIMIKQIPLTLKFNYRVMRCPADNRF